MYDPCVGQQRKQGAEDGMMCSLTPEAVSRNIEELLKNPQKCRELGQKASVKLSSEDKDVLKLFQI